MQQLLKKLNYLKKVEKNWDKTDKQFDQAIFELNITPAAEIVRQADILVIIGTSLVVYPAAGLMYYARKGTPIYYIDPNPAQIPSDMQNVTVIAKPATVGVAELKEILTR